MPIIKGDDGKHYEVDETNELKPEVIQKRIDFHKQQADHFSEILADITGSTEQPAEPVEVPTAPEPRRIEVLDGSDEADTTEQPTFVG